MSLNKQDDKKILDIGVIVKKTKLLRTTTAYTNIVSLNDYMYYAIYELNGELTYKEVSKEEYEKIDIN